MRPARMLERYEALTEPPVASSISRNAQRSPSGRRKASSKSSNFSASLVGLGARTPPYGGSYLTEREIVYLCHNETHYKCKRVLIVNTNVSRWKRYQPHNIN